MQHDVVPIQIRGILPANSGVALFLGNNEKVFVIQVEHNMGAIIGMALRGTPKDRPLTHDLIHHVFQGFGISVERVVITELRNATYYARLILKQTNELGTKIVELDARPSDCLAIAAAAKRPIYAASTLFDEVEDMSEVLDRLNEEQANGDANDDPDLDDDEDGEEDDNDSGDLDPMDPMDDSEDSEDPEDSDTPSSPDEGPTDKPS
jgi:bifunctional DNase/RNase